MRQYHGGWGGVKKGEGGEEDWILLALQVLLVPFSVGFASSFLSLAN